MNCIIARIENYKMSAAGGVGKEQEREQEYIQKHYHNPDFDPGRLQDNVTLYHDPFRDGRTWERYIKDFRQENDIQGRFTVKGPDKSQTNVLTGFMVTASPDYITGMSKGEQEQFFQDAFQFLQQQYPTYHWIEATIHRDEKTPHLHALALPLCRDPEKDRTIFSTTKTQEGREHYREFQDRIYQHMSSRWHGLERGVPGSEKQHLTVQEYKEKMDLQKDREGLQKEREDLQKEKESFHGPTPEKIPLLGTRYKAQDVAKVVELNKALYGENERLKTENKGLREDLSRAAMMYDRLDKENKLYEQDRQETMERMQDPDFLRERLRAIDRAQRDISPPEHTPAYNHGDGPGR